MAKVLENKGLRPFFYAHLSLSCRLNLQADSGNGSMKAEDSVYRIGRIRLADRFRDQDPGAVESLTSGIRWLGLCGDGGLDIASDDGDCSLKG